MTVEAVGRHHCILGSHALLAFGVDSIIELISSFTVLSHLNAEVAKNGRGILIAQACAFIFGVGGRMLAPLQTPLPGSESEALLVAAVFVWLVICYVLAHFSDKSMFGEFFSFIIFVVSVLVLLFLLY